MAEHLALGRQENRVWEGREGGRGGKEEGRNEKKGSSGHSSPAMCLLSCEFGATYSADPLSLNVR